MDLGLREKVAVVTGASRGIGRAAAGALAQEGATVLLTARGEHDLNKAVAELTAAGHDAAGLRVDLSTPEAAGAAVDEAVQRWGRVDILVNNAGGGPAGSDHVRSFDPDTWLDVYRRNVIVPMALSSACLPGMAERGWGRILNVASTMARDPDPRFGSYGAAKAALAHVTRSLAQAYAAQGVMINAVLPGLTRSEGVLSGYADAAAASGRTPEQIEERMMQLQPIAAGRTGEPEEVAAAIAFLCSERASWITGALLLVDGGTVRVLP
ncbi:MAG TPA: SDR family oxidoreductase [Acidimicrobiales bacterium]|nr:SDR family oxidoreductase [Acidimicrobiales bacterium]